MKDEFSNILNSSIGEREVTKFLEQNPNVIRWAVCQYGGHTTYVIKEYPFGSRYRADFIVVTSYSGVWEVNLIELEPIDDIVITKEGMPSQRLNKAISQINDWKEYIEQYPGIFRNDLSKWCMDKDLLNFDTTGDKPCNFTGDYLDSLDTFIRYNYFIIIGHRDKIDVEKRRKRNQISHSNQIKIHTYNRLLDVILKLDV